MSIHIYRVFNEENSQAVVFAFISKGCLNFGIAIHSFHITVKNLFCKFTKWPPGMQSP